MIEETPLTKFTIEEIRHGWFEVQKYNEWEDGTTLIIEWTTHETREQAEEQNSKNKEGFWGTL
tara:strand:- start:171 stop:359 length:189 start_codon:yes stop_codon:yes gene_type:complete